MNASTEIKGHVRRLIEWTGADTGHESLTHTPAATAEAFQALLDGYRTDPANIPRKKAGTPYSGLTTANRIPFYTFCELHLLPIYGTADIGYLPGRTTAPNPETLPAFLNCYAHRLQNPPKLTEELCEAIHKHLESRGTAVILQISHPCLACSGRHTTGTTGTTSFRGALAGGVAQNEFFRLLNLPANV